jgi:hypothetical protein
LLAAVCHIPPAFSQSAFVVYCERSPEAPDGLAAGDELDPLPDVLGIVELPVLEPVPELLPDVDPEGLEPDPLPGLGVLGDCAAAIAGARATSATRTATKIVVMLTSLFE